MGTPTIDTIDNNPADEVLAYITLEAPRFIDADARHISRLLKAESLPRAERHKGSSTYSWGFNVTGNSVSVYGGTPYLDRDRAGALLIHATEILRAKGFVVTGTGSSRHVFKPVATPDDDATFWDNLHLVCVGVDNTLVTASRVPAFKEEKERRRQQAKQVKLEREREAKANQQATESFADALRRNGLALELRYGTISVKADTFATWLKTKGVVL